jgi:hypothetical protein
MEEAGYLPRNRSASDGELATDIVPHANVPSIPTSSSAGFEGGIRSQSFALLLVLTEGRKETIEGEERVARWSRDPPGVTLEN